MRIPIDRESATPLYRQIEQFLRQQILSGRLTPEMRLPATRELAHSLGVNRITINSAYAELESQGLIFSSLGAGSFVSRSSASFPRIVRNEIPPEGFPAWQGSLAGSGRWSEAVTRHRDLAGPQPDSGFISFAGGAGDERLFPVEEFRKTLQVVLCRDGHQALDYGERRGYRPLRVTIAGILTGEGIPAHPDQVLVTSGSQQAVALVAHLLLSPGDTVAVEVPTYSGALDLFRSLDLNIVGVPLDAEGMRLEVLEQVLADVGPRLVYTIPNFHNPTGICLGAERRRKLVDLGARFDVPILEDDYVGDLRYEGSDLPALKTLDVNGGVIYVRTFSKMLMPGLRIGYILAQGPVLGYLEECKRVSDLSSSSLIQRALESYITVGRYQAHLRRACSAYRRRRDRLMEELSAQIPHGVRWRAPAGGLFLWLEPPPGTSTTRVAEMAAEQSVGLVPSTCFYADGQDRPFLRLNFADQPEDRIAEGAARLSRVLRACLG